VTAAPGGQRPRVSVCIPVYNGAPYIADTIRSVLAQDDPDFELLVVDNASTDGTLDVVGGFRDARIRIERNASNIGAVGNFNRALDLARGTYVKIVCADDLLRPDCLRRQVAAMDAGGGRLALAGCGRDIIDETGRRWLSRRFPGAEGPRDAVSAVRRMTRSGTNLIGEPAAVLMARTAIDKAGRFDPAFKYCLDLEFWCRLLRHGDLYAIPDPLCSFRVTKGSWSVAIASGQAEEFGRFIETVARERGFGISRMDMFLGRLHARRQGWMRSVFYRMVNRSA
jgi:glycosyltransferase involved in cell wall biosynthesis